MSEGGRGGRCVCCHQGLVVVVAVAVAVVALGRIKPMSMPRGQGGTTGIASFVNK